MTRVLDEAVLRGIGAMYQSGVVRIGGSPKCRHGSRWQSAVFVAGTVAVSGVA
ncbi:hypothetical protein ACIA5H_08705 [Nocardia sp. NPDC051900]|uniref:hypothetical protein n=1 Tax=Nocardia sp. NPDC051900 TaxID=3364326 RepID=UPI0037AEA73E